MWPILCGLNTRLSVSTAQIISDNGKNFVSQKQKSDGFARLFQDESNLKFEKYERGMKKALNSRLRNEVVNTEAYQGLTTDNVKTVHCNINPTIAAGPNKIQPRYLPHLGKVSMSLLTSILAETKILQEWRVADIRPMPKGRKEQQNMESYRPISFTSIVGKIV